MQCDKCGSELSENSKFCPECGTPVTASANEPASDSTPQAPVGQDASAQQQTPPPPNTQPAADEPWYGKTWVIILFLIFIWPVGLVLMWLKTCHWKRYAKIIVSAACALMLIMQIVSISSLMAGPQTPTDPPYTTASSSAAKSSSKSTSSSSATSKPSASSKATFDNKYYSDGVPNIVAVMDLSGADLATMCEQQGLKWSASDNKFEGDITGLAFELWANSPDGKSLSESAFKAQGALSKSNDPIWIKVSIESPDLKTATSRFLKGMEADASALNPDKTTSMFFMSQENGDDALVYANWNANTKITTFYCYNDAFCKSGNLLDTMDGGKTGLTCGKAFDYFAQRVSKEGWQVAG